MASQIVRTEPLLETQGVQNSSFEFESALLTLLDEEKAIALNREENVCFSSECPLPSACRGKGTRDVQNSSFKACDCLFPLPVEELDAQKKWVLSHGHLRPPETPRARGPPH